jgi:hypothetical protein
MAASSAVTTLGAFDPALAIALNSNGQRAKNKEYSDDWTIPAKFLFASQGFDFNHSSKYGILVNSCGVTKLAAALLITENECQIHRKNRDNSVYTESFLIVLHLQCGKKTTYVIGKQ